MRRWGEFIAAATLLTRLPVARFNSARAWPADRDAVWAYPVVGALVGAAGGAVVWFCARMGLPPSVGALLGLAAMLLLTGGLHEDGLADTADGFGGGATATRKLEIMRDSRIGAFGALALIISIGVRVAALAAIPAPNAVPALVASGGLGRGAIAAILLVSRPARAEGLAAALWPARGRVVACALAFAACAAFALPPRVACAAILGAACAAAGMATLARAQVGGFTGDVLGASEVVAECVVLCVVSAMV